MPEKKIIIYAFLTFLFFLALGAGVVNILPSFWLSDSQNRDAVTATPVDVKGAESSGSKNKVPPEITTPSEVPTAPRVSAPRTPEKQTVQTPKAKESKSAALAPNDTNKNGVFVEPATMAEKKINIQTIVMVRCAFYSQYFKESSQPWNEEKFRVGSGVIISPDGHILTAEHIAVKDLSPDKSGRKWKRGECYIAQTDARQTPIVSVGYWGQPDDPRFKKTDIVFEPTKEEYADSSGLDFAILKIEEPVKTSFAALVPKLIDFREDGGAPILTIGYPGKISSVPQELERLDAKFKELTYFKNSPCDGTIKACGLRYQALRSLSEYLNIFWKKTALGIITPYFRKGFSGAPAFFKGNLVGIVTHGKSGDDPAVAGIQVSEPDSEDILTSYDISETLKKNGISF